MLRSLGRLAVDVRARRRGELRPPRRLLAPTSSPTPWEFVAAGLVNLEICRLAGLQPTDRVLDIGSGVGRLAIPLTGQLAPPGSYTGVDLWPDGVAWCTRTITPRHPHFTFRLLDYHHPDLRPRSSRPLASVRLPFDDVSFDLAVLVAINHLSAADHRALVAEAGRVLRPGGTYAGTWFLVDDSTAALLPAPYRDVSCSPAALDDALAAGGLERRALFPGSWRATPDAVSLQDVVIATKNGS